MRGLRIRGRRTLARHAGGGASVAILASLAIALAGCFKQDAAELRRDGEVVIEILSTSEQVQRARKADALIVLATVSPPAHPAVPAREQQAAPPPPPSASPTRPLPPSSHGSVVPGPRVAPDARYPLAHFHNVLRDLDAGVRHAPVTILHLGDSHIASDRFTGDIREALQARFGDAGRGLMMPGFPFDYYRARGVEFSKAGAWVASNSFREASGRYGVTGVRLTTQQKDARITLTSRSGPFEWAEVTFLVGAGHGSALVAVDGDARRVDTGSGEGARRVRIEHKGGELTVRSLGGGPVSILSWAVGHNRPGIRYVNLGIPGATADTTRRWNDALVHDDVAALAPDLIVLGYGTNEGFNDALDIGGYEKRVAELVRKLRDAAPQASLAIVGPADGARLPRYARATGSSVCRALSESERRDYARLVRAGSASLARWHAPPSLSEVRGALQRVALSHGAHFWDWSRMMGGECGIHEWAKAKLALSDHVHISNEGSRRSAQAFLQSLMAGYDDGGKVASRSDAFGPTSSVSQ